MHSIHLCFPGGFSYCSFPYVISVLLVSVSTVGSSPMWYTHWTIPSTVYLMMLLHWPHPKMLLPKCDFLIVHMHTSPSLFFPIPLYYNGLEKWIATTIEKKKHQWFFMSPIQLWCHVIPVGHLCVTQGEWSIGHCYHFYICVSYFMEKKL